MPNTALPRVTHFEKSGKRALMVINPRASCSSALKHGPCKFCAFWEKRPDGDGQLFESAAANAVELGCTRAEILVSGSFFDVAQVSGDERSGMLRHLAGLGRLTHVMVESRPEYIEHDSIREAVRCAGTKALEVAIGLETANDYMRDMCGKRFSIFDFYDAVSEIAGAGAFPVAYLLVGYHHLSKSNEDVLSSAYAVKKLEDKIGRRIRLALQAYFPPKDGHSAIVSAGTVAGMAVWIRNNLGMEVFIATSAEGRSTHPLAHARHVFEEFNDTQDPGTLSSVIDKRVVMPRLG